MSEDWRGDPSHQTAISKWLRGRWRYGSLKVLDLDVIIVSNDYQRGLLAEAKHVKAANKTWYCTKTLARRLGFYGALLTYDTDDGTDRGNVLDDSVSATIYDPDGNLIKEGPIDVAKFNLWVQEKFGG